MERSFQAVQDQRPFFHAGQVSRSTTYAGRRRLLSSTEPMSIPNDLFVYDGMSHALNFDRSNYKVEQDAHAMVQMMYAMTQNTMAGHLSNYLVTYESYCRN